MGTFRSLIVLAAGAAMRRGSARTGSPGDGQAAGGLYRYSVRPAGSSPRFRAKLSGRMRSRPGPRKPLSAAVSYTPRSSTRSKSSSGRLGDSSARTSPTHRRNGC